MHTRSFLALFAIVTLPLLLIAPVASAQETDPAPAQPLSTGSDLLSNVVTDLRPRPIERPKLPPMIELDRVDEQPVAPTASEADESDLDEQPALTTSTDEEEGAATSTTKSGTESAADLNPREFEPLGADSGLFSFGTSRGRDGDETAAPLLGGLGGEFTRTAGALAVVIGVLLIGYMLVRRMGGPLASGGRPGGVLEILARYPIGRRQHLVLLKMGRRILLLHQHGTELSTLADVSDPDEAASLLARIEAGSRGGKFQEALYREERSFITDDRARGTGGTGGAGGARIAPSDPVEVVDLTRTQGGGLRRAFGKWGAAA